MFTRLYQYLAHPKQRASAGLFILNAFLFGQWSTLLPSIMDSLSIGEQELGIALFAAPLGVVLFSPISGSLMNKYGAGKLAFFAGLGQCIALVFLALPQNLWQLALGFFFYGLWNGALDIGMNGCISSLETEQDKKLMSTAHGFWSLGAMIAVFAAGLLAQTGLNYRLHLTTTGLFALLLLLPTAKFITPIGKDSTTSQTKWTWPGWYLVILIGIGFLVFMVEGGLADWLSVFYEKVLGAPKKLWGLGFGVFSATMAIARFNGDWILEKVNEKVLLVSCGILATLGLALFAFNQDIVVNTVAMVITGLACSILVPLIFSAAGQGKMVTPGQGLAMVGTIGYAGFLIGPPIIGQIAEYRGLNQSFGFLAILMAIVTVLSLVAQKWK